MGQGLRFVQEYFLVACSLADLVRRFRRDNTDWSALPDKVAIQLNDTHPTLAVPELMRILLDEAHLGWDEAWDLTQRTLAYTNHTLLPEALEKWPLHWFELMLPRQLEIIYEINRRFLDDVRRRYPGDEARVARMSLIEEGPERQGPHGQPGDRRLAQHQRRRRDPFRAAAHDDGQGLGGDVSRSASTTRPTASRRGAGCCWPIRRCRSVITDAIGDGWITDLSEIARARSRWPTTPAFRDAFLRAKREAKVAIRRLAASRPRGQTVDPDSIFDCQIKRIHEYKRQLLNALRIVVLYNRLRENPDLDMPPRTFFFAGKAAPAYHLAKLIIKFINNLAGTIDGDPVGPRPAQGGVPAGILRLAGRAADPGQPTSPTRSRPPATKPAAPAT